MFLREVKITARLQHPGVVPIYDLMHAEGQALVCHAIYQGADAPSGYRHLLRHAVTSDGFDYVACIQPRGIEVMAEFMPRKHGKF